MLNFLNNNIIHLSLLSIIGLVLGFLFFYVDSSVEIINGSNEHELNDMENKLFKSEDKCFRIKKKIEKDCVS
jgi:hypothetical protein